MSDVTDPETISSKIRDDIDYAIKCCDSSAGNVARPDTAAAVLRLARFRVAALVAERDRYRDALKAIQVRSNGPAPYALVDMQTLARAALAVSTP